MKKYLYTYLIYIIFGAAFGYVWESGVLGLFETNPDYDSSPHWESVTTEDYKEDIVAGIQYGAVGGFLLATIVCVRTVMARKRSDLDSSEP